MQRRNCLNCGEVLQEHHQYCYRCGQKTDTPRITNRSLIKDVFQYFTHAERGLFNLFKGLAVRPGNVAAEYVEGKRKTYFNPFGFLALCIALMALLNSQIKPYNDLTVPDPRIMARMPDERLKNLYLLTVERNARVQNVANKNLNLISVAVTPYFAFFLWLFFRERQRNFAEICVAYILFTGFANVASTILFSPWLAMTRNTGWHYPILYSNLFLQTFYYTWGMKAFFNYKTTGGFFKVYAVLAGAGIIGFILLIVVYFYYVYHGETMEVLRYIGGK